TVIRTPPPYLIPESIRRRLARAKAWGEPRVCVGGNCWSLTAQLVIGVQLRTAASPQTAVD
uniref:Uncharacterized protein n=1 Tax=Callorhinchus milii TaxID=7868 RepID=A0A4W3IN48_CALMI